MWSVLSREIGPAARLAVENERLQAEVLAELEDLRRSRARIVERGDWERRRLQEVDRVLGEGISETPAIDQPRILLVDDDPTVRALARALLEKNGFRVTEVGDGAEAIEHFTIGEECALVVARSQSADPQRARGSRPTSELAAPEADRRLSAAG